MKKDKAKAISEHVIELLKNHVFDIQEAGSLRRGKPFPSDVEFVCIPKEQFSREIESLVNRQLVKWSVYVDRNGKVSHRKGPLYWGIELLGEHVEIFLAHQNNFGYQYWLRTGPSEANQFVMQWMAYHQSPYRPKGGEWYWLEEPEKPIVLKTEDDLFGLWGMPYIAPEKRSIEVYEGLLKLSNFKKPDQIEYQKILVQESLL